MAPVKPLKKDTGGTRVNAVLDLAKKATRILKNREPPPIGLENELESAIKRTFPALSGASLAASSAELDSLGCELWNAATNILQQAQCQQEPQAHDDKNGRIVIVGRVFAFLLIEAAHKATSNRSEDSDQRVRVLKIALKACRSCIDRQELALALQIQEICTEYVTASKENSPMVRISSSDRDERETMMQSLVAEFHLLRLAHAWKSDRLDMAEHFFSQVPTFQLCDVSGIAEKAADLFYEIGLSLLRTKSDELAMRWLERSMDTLDSCDAGTQGQALITLRHAVTSSITQCLLRAGTPESVKRAAALVDRLHIDDDLSTPMSIRLMEFNIQLALTPLPLDRIQVNLAKMFRVVVLSESNFKLIMQALHRFRKVHAAAARQSLAYFLTTRLLGTVEEENGTSDSGLRLEQASITYIQFATTDSESTQRSATEDLRQILDRIAHSDGYSFSPTATHAAQALVWRTMDVVGKDVADAWCRLLQHPVFDSAGQTNKTKIARKVMRTAIMSNDFEAARGAFYHMPTATQNDSMTRYVAFQLALRSNDYELAEESLQEIAKQAKQDQTFLYACVLEAQQCDMRHIAVAALQAVLDKNPADVHLPSLLRCTARLLSGELNDSGRRLDEVMAEVIPHFETAAHRIQALKKAAGDQWRSEVQWWSKNAYNLSTQYCTGMQPEHLVRLLNVCARFIENLSTNDSAMHQDGFAKRKSQCHFLCACAHIILARSTAKGSESGLQSYLQARQQIAAFTSAYGQAGGEEKVGLDKKAFEMLKFDLECILHLQQWDDLDEALKACLTFTDVERWETLADVVLIIRQHPESSGHGAETKANMNKLLDRIINDTWQKDKNIIKASRWLRLSFSMDLTDGNGSFALQLLTQAASMAKKGYSKVDGMYPETELQWLAVTAFNKAVDLLATGNVDASQEWIRGALELARYADDNGALHANLTSKQEQAMDRLKHSSG